MGASQLRNLLVAALFALIGFFVLADLPLDQRVVAAVFLAAVWLWGSEAFPLGLTAAVAPLLLLFVGTISVLDYFGSFFNNIILLIAASLVLARGAALSGLAERVALLVLASRFAGGSFPRLLLSLGAVSCVMSMLISNTAVAALMMPVATSIVQTLGTSDNRQYATAVFLMLSWGASLAVASLIASPPYLIGASFLSSATGAEIGFLSWASFGAPINIVLIIFGWGLLLLMFGRGAPDPSAAQQVARRALRERGGMTTRERAVVLLLAGTVVLWLLPDLSRLVMGQAPLAQQIAKLLVPGYVAAFSASILVLLPVTYRPFARREALGIDWNVILLFGGGIALGKAAFDTGLTNSLGESLVALTGVESTFGLTALCGAIAIGISELSSNTASASMLVPLALGLAAVTGVTPHAPVLASAIGASLGFMMPISTPPNSIVYSSGYVTVAQMAKAGVLLDLIGWAVMIVVLRLVLPLLGWW